MLTLIKPAPPKKVPISHIEAGLRAFFRITEKWGVDNDQAMVLLGQPSRATFFKWKKGEVASAAQSLDLASRLSHVLGIFRSLQIIYQKPELADRWVTAPNMAFGGQSALDRMMGGQITDLATVRDYLDSVRGGW